MAREAATVSLPQAFDSWLESAFSPSTKQGASSKRLLAPLRAKPLLPPPSSTSLPLQRMTLPSLHPTENRLAVDASYRTTSYPTSNLRPRLAFFSVLAALPSMACNVPPTLLGTGYGSFLLLYTSSTSTSTAWRVQAYATKAALLMDTTKLLRLFTGRVCFKTHEPQGNRLELIQSNRAILQHIDTMASSALETALQAFVQPKGTHAWLVRVDWRAKHPNGGVVWILTDHDHEYTDTSSCTIDKSISKTSWPVPKALTAQLVQAVQGTLEVKFKWLVADYVQDADGEWWLLQVKAFQVQKRHLYNPTTPPPPSANQCDEAGTKCRGKGCRASATNAAMTISYKDYLHVQFRHTHDESEWTHYLATLHRKDRNQLYNRVALCDSCWPHYQLKEPVKPAKPKRKTVSTTHANDITTTTVHDMLSSLESMLHIVVDGRPQPSISTDAMRQTHTDTSPPPPASRQTKEHEPTLAAQACPLEPETPSPEKPVANKAIDATLELAKDHPSPNPKQAVPLHATPGVINTTSTASASSVALSHIDALWSTMAPSPLASLPSSSSSATTSAATSVVVLPQEILSVDAAQYYCDDAYKAELLTAIRFHFSHLHVVRLEGDDPMALHSIFLDVQDECLEGHYGLLDRVTTTHITLTPYFRISK
ncbi:Aste57867_9488 [Aphanomyces stellatus]|uniref:Aste57867_9488 protein n=1 Tax=Aphanomyces stellatus TaxID=120398 RepID=A0A485KN40_9STRA|nr:hypothetical protein As57867_009451 [Aphanomyces stellatus]VFT86367.1 Aste57867_9488 [Aphanomyces stellatus]